MTPQAAEILRSEAERMLAMAEQPGPLAQAVDRLVGFVSPTRAWRRSQDRMAIAFHAAEVNRLTADYMPDEQTADQALLEDMALLVARCRESRINDGPIRGICNGYVRDVVGAGITARSAARGADGKPLVEWNRALDDLWLAWATTTEFCDYLGERSLRQFNAFQVDECVQTGNGMLVERYERRPGTVGLSLQAIEYEQLDREKTRHGRNEVREGVEIDRVGRVVAYHVYQDGHRLEEIGAKSTRVLRGQVHHLRANLRGRETLSPPLLAASVMLSRDLTMFVRDNERRNRLAACVFAQVIRKPGTPGGGKPVTGMGAAVQENVTDARGRTVNQMPSGTLLNPPAGHEIKVENTNLQGSEMSAYVDHAITMIAAAANRSGSSVTRKYSSSYTAERRSLIEDQKVTEPMQLDLIETTLQPIKAKFVRFALLERRLELPEGFGVDEESLEALARTAWSPPEVKEIDPAKQAAADKIDIETKKKSRAEINQRRNRTTREVFDEIAEDQELAEERDIVLPERNGGAKTDAHEPRPRGASRSPDGVEDDNRGSDDDAEALVGAIVREAVVSNA